MVCVEFFIHWVLVPVQDYGLVLVGHSLGAGVASLLAILLKKHYQNLHCYAYSPPGGLLW